MKKYKIHIEEIIEKDIYIEAKDMHEAKSKVVKKLKINENIKWILEKK